MIKMANFKIRIIIFCFVTILNDVIDGSKSQTSRKSLKGNIGSTSQTLRKPLKENVSDPDNIKDPKKALNFFNEHGLLDEAQNKVYSAINSKTSIMYAHGVCKRVIEELYKGRQSLKKVEVSYNSKVSTKVYSIGYMDMVHSNRDYLYLFGAKCFYGDGKDDYLFICDSSKKPFYYIFSQQTNNQFLNIKACLKITTKDSDFPELTIKETTDDKIADSIFAINNPPPLKKVDYHVCSVQQIGKKVVMRGKVVCENFLTREGRRRSKIETFTDLSAKCEEHQITRQILKENNEFVKSREYFGVVCTYKDLEDGRKLKSILTLNAPRKGFYYVAKNKILSDPDLGPAQLPVGWVINSCVQIAEPE